MEVRTARLRLRGLRSTDRAAWIRGMEASAALHAPWAPLPAPGLTLADRFAAQLTAHESGACFKGVAWTDDGELVAWVNLNDIVRGVSWSANAGWSVHAHHAGQGYATEAVGALLDVAFAPDGLGLHRVACGIIPDNVRSRRVAERCGFRREGHALELVCIAGHWRDHDLYAKLAREHLPATR